MRIVIVADAEKLQEIAPSYQCASVEQLLSEYLRDWIAKAYEDLEIALGGHHALASVLAKISSAASKAFGIAPMDPPFVITTESSIDGKRAVLTINVFSYEQMLVDMFGGEEKFKEKMLEGEKKLSKVERIKLRMIGGMDALLDSAVRSRKFRDIAIQQFKDSFPGAFLYDQ
jgi:hypothetical protein